jgi:membrane protease YdiL (CAAX protease family)
MSNEPDSQRLPGDYPPLPAWSQEHAQPQDARAPEAVESATVPSMPPPFAEPTEQQTPIPQVDAPLLFQQYMVTSAPPKERIPHIGHIAMLALIALCCLAVSALLARAGVYFHLFGATTVEQAATEIHYTLGTEGIFYFLTLGASMVVFPLLWNKPFFPALQWRGSVARNNIAFLLGAAVICFVLAVLSGMLMPGPPDAPIDKMFRLPDAAWLLFGFGITLAPFFEELAFRGFLLPALSTAFDWAAEKVNHQPAHQVDTFDHPQWSIPAMVVSAVVTSILFAFMHAAQTGYSLGPFLLLVAVSLVLCGARLWFRSLAASVVIHASYNFLLFSLMFLGTSGFKHLDKM